MKNDKGSPAGPWWQSGLILFTRLSGWIAGPIILAVLIGKWLDNKYHTEPWLFLLSVGVAFIFSTFGIIRDSMREMNRINKEAEDKKRDEKKKEK